LLPLPDGQGQGGAKKGQVLNENSGLSLGQKPNLQEVYLFVGIAEKRNENQFFLYRQSAQKPRY
jgi:hypothetical protein